MLTKEPCCFPTTGRVSTARVSQQPARSQWPTSQPRILQPPALQAIFHGPDAHRAPPLANPWLCSASSTPSLAPHPALSHLLGSARAASTGHPSFTPHLVPTMSQALQLGLPESHRLGSGGPTVCTVKMGNLRLGGGGLGPRPQSHDRE